MDTQTDAALNYFENGFSVIPIKIDGSKGPLIPWKEYMENRASVDQIKSWVITYGAFGIGLITGQVSGNAEVVDFDDKETYFRWRKLAEAQFPTLIGNLCVTETPDGFHVWYRCEENIEASQVLAARFVDGKRKILAETRGARGYALVPGSHPKTHPSGIPYKLIQGSFGNVPKLSGLQRNQLLRSVKEFDETEAHASQASPVGTPPRNTSGHVIDSYNEGEDWANILRPKGFQLISSDSDGQSKWQKPDSSNAGHHVTVNFKGSDKLYSFSDACIFKQGTTYSKFDAFSLLYCDGNVTAAIEKLLELGWSAIPENKKQHVEKNLIDILIKQCELWHCEDQNAYVSFSVSERLENQAVDSILFKDWLATTYYELHRHFPTEEQIKRSLQWVTYHAQKGKEYKPTVRIGTYGGDIYLDLADKEGHVAHINQIGWQVVKTSPVKFIRKRGMRSLPIPQIGKGLDNLLGLFSLDEASLVLLKSWILGAIRPRGPFPILILQGQQGTAKSTLARAVRNLIDPATPLLRALPKDEEDLAIAAFNSGIIAFDNMSSVRHWLADALCRFSTGGGWAKRRLYTDQDEVILDIQKPIILNGIDDLATRGDLADRSIVIHLEPIPDNKRMSESDFWLFYEDIWPTALGEVLSSASLALKNLPKIKLKESPRMADFASWVVAAEDNADSESSRFLFEYAKNRKDSLYASTQSYSICAAVESLAGSGGFEGTATELLVALQKHDSRVQNEIKSPVTLGNNLRRIADGLRVKGIEITFIRNRDRLIRIRRSQN